MLKNVVIFLFSPFFTVSMSSILDHELVDKSSHPPPGACSGGDHSGQRGEWGGHNIQGGAREKHRKMFKNDRQSVFSLDNELLQGGLLHIELQLLLGSAGHV